MKLNRVAGTTSQIWQIQIVNSASGLPLTGLVFNTASLTAYYHRDTDTTATAIALVTMTVGTFTSSGFKEIDATNMPGWYQFCPPNAALAASAASCAFHLRGAANMLDLPIEVDLDPQADVRQWLGTAVTAATAGIPDTNAKNINNVSTASITTINANIGMTQPINFTGTGASALVKSDTVDIAGAAVSATTAQLGVNVVNWNNTVVATPAMAGIPDINVKNIVNVAATLDANNFLKVCTTDWAGGTIPAPNVTGIPLIDLKYTLGTISPATTGYVAIDWAQIANKTATVALTNTTISGGATPTVAAIATAVWQDATAGDFTAANSIGKSLYTAGVVPGGVGGLFIAGTNAATAVNITGTWTGNIVGTLSTLTTYTGNTLQTGDSFARLGVAGVGLTNLGDTRIANLDAAITTRMASYTQPTGFLAATFPSGTIANTTNIAAGTMTTTTNLTNAATLGDLTATMKTSVTTAATAATPIAASVAGNVVGSVGSVVARVSTTQNAQKNSALAGYEFQMVNSTAPFNPGTGLTVSGFVSKDGAAYTALTNAVSELSNGTYIINLAAADLNCNVANLMFQATGAFQTNNVIITTP